MHLLKRHKFILLLVKIIPSFKYQYFSCDNYKIYGNLLDSTVRQAFIRNSFEDDVLFDAITFFLQQGKNYIDVGANYGFHSFGLLPKLKESKVKLHLFEPNKDCQKCLKETIRRGKFENVFIHGMALGKRGGSTIFHCDQRETITGSLEELFVNKYQELQIQGKWDSYQVPIKMLDTWLKESQLDEVRVMKLDTSGNDWSIYKGGEEAFKHGKIQVLFFDLLKVQLKLHGTKTTQILSFLKNCGYELYDSLSASTSNKTKDTFSINNKHLSFSKLNIKELIDKDDNQDFLPHVSALAIHSTFKDK